MGIDHNNVWPLDCGVETPVSWFDSHTSVAIDVAQHLGKDIANGMVEGIAGADATWAGGEVERVLVCVRLAATSAPAGEGLDGQEQGALVVHDHINACLKASVSRCNFVKAAWACAHPVEGALGALFQHDSTSSRSGSLEGNSKVSRVEEG